jgi:formylglycine-generating enzyme required for sulfatase activity
LGEFSGEQLSAKQQEALVAGLLRWYRDDPDPGIHSAIDWLLRHERQGNAARKLAWQQDEGLTRIDRELAGRPPQDRRWYVTREGHTLAVVRDPIEFLMGSPVHEPDRIAPNEAQHRRRIRRSFAISTKEVTVMQFQRFLEDNPDVKRRHVELDDPDRLSRLSPENNGPAIAVTWFEAAQYCNWLSKQEGITKDQWCYPNIDKFEDGMVMPNGWLQRTGYRLPLEVEWEYACRAGATTSRFFGSSETVLKEYAWYGASTSSRRTWPVGQLKPNDLGLFDIYGNVKEWCQDRLLAFPTVLFAEDSERKITADLRAQRGGGFTDGVIEMRSACRDWDRPAGLFYNVGVRIAKTYR